MVARLAHTLHLLWEFTQRQACLSANAPRFPASAGTALQLCGMFYSNAAEERCKADGELEASRIEKLVLRLFAV